MKEDASENLLYICIYIMVYSFHLITFISFYLILLVFLSKIYFMFDLLKI